MAVHLQLASAPSRGPAAAENAATDPVRVVLADDRARARRELRRLLDGAGGINVIGEIGDGLPPRRDPRDEPQVLVLELELSGGASIATIKQLRERLPGARIAVLSADRSPVFAQRALEAGAVAYVVKEAADAELCSAVRSAAEGVEYVSPSIAAGLDGIRRAARGEGISRRETEVLRLIALGHTSSEIAEELHVSRRTVDSHRASIHRKLGLRTRADLVRFALSRGLLGD